MMSENVELQEKSNLGSRTKAFATRIVKLYVALPKSPEAQVLGKQLLRSGTSVGAHYREARRARSPAEFISKLEVGIQELDETQYWLELLIDCQIVRQELLGELICESEEILAMLVASTKTVKQKQQAKKPK